jgi:DNA repair exonuclease SbcCD ATPase subunit
LSGPIGTGKTTLFELIKYCLGGNARLTPAVQEHVLRAEVMVSLQGEQFILSRIVGRGSDTVTISDGRSRDFIGEYPATRVRIAPEKPTIGDVLLERLGFPPNLSVTTRARTQRLSFGNLFSFIYVEQREIDRSIAKNADTWADPARKAMFELLFNLRDGTAMELDRDLNEARESEREARLQLQAIDQFLSDTQVESRISAERQLESSRHRLRLARHTQADLHNATTPLRREFSVLRDLVTTKRSTLDSLAATRRALEEDATRYSAFIVELEGQIAELDRQATAVSYLAPIEFHTCPRCAQALKGRTAPEDTCRLCLQPEVESTAFPVSPPPEERASLTSQLSEVQELREHARRELRRLDEQVRHGRADLRALEERLDIQTSNFLSPRLEKFTEVAVAIAESSASVANLEQMLTMWDRRQDMLLASERAAGAAKRLSEAVREARKELTQARTHLIETLSNDYALLISEVGLPIDGDPRVSDRDYLPYVGDTRFDRVSTGGIATVLVTAYWITLLATALRERTTLYPSLLILDTPRKSTGTNEHALIAAVYRQLDVLAAVSGNRMQVIVADNDVPDTISSTWQTLEFDYDHPTLFPVPHPGPNRVTPLDASEDHDETQYS